MRTIIKKILPEYFDKIVSGEKTYELRLNDFECQTNDKLVLKEWDGKTYTGREIAKTVGYVGRTKDYDFWDETEIQNHGYMIISLLD